MQFIEIEILIYCDFNLYYEYVINLVLSNLLKSTELDLFLNS